MRLISFHLYAKLMCKLYGSSSPCKFVSCIFWRQCFLIFLSLMFLKGKNIGFSNNQSNCRVTQPASRITFLYEKGYSASSTLFRVYSTFHNKDRATIYRLFKKLEGDISDAWRQIGGRVWWLKVIIACHETLLSSFTVRRVQFCGDVQKSCQVGYLSACPSIVIAKSCKSQNLCIVISMHFIYRSNYKKPCSVDIVQKVREMGFIETPWLRAAAKSEQLWPKTLYLHFLELLWTSSRKVLQNRPNGDFWCSLSQTHSSYWQI